MTREEYSDKLLNSKSVSESMLTAISYISSLEAKIGELKAPKSCATCLYFERSEHEFGHYEGTCLAFIVQNKDFQTVDDSFCCIEYESKDN